MPGNFSKKTSGWHDAEQFLQFFPAVIKNAFQLGFGYEASKHVTLNAVYHHGASGDGISGPMLNPMMVSGSNPYGAVPSSSVSYKMTTDLIMFGVNYTF